MADTIKITTLAQLKVALQAAKTYIDGQIGGLGTLAGKSEVAYDDLAAALKTLIDGKAAQATVDTLIGEDTGKSVRTISSEEVAKIVAGIAAGAQANVIEKIKVNGVEVTPAAEDKSIDLTIPTGKLAGKDIVAEADLDAALKEKVNAAAEGNHSHANKAFLDTLSGATDEEVTAMCTEVFGA